MCREGNQLKLAAVHPVHPHFPLLWLLVALRGLCGTGRYKTYDIGIATVGEMLDAQEEGGVGCSGGIFMCPERGHFDSASGLGWVLLACLKARPCARQSGQRQHDPHPSNVARVHGWQAVYLHDTSIELFCPGLMEDVRCSKHVSKIWYTVPTN